MASKTCPEKESVQKMIYFKLFVIWQLDGKYASLKKNLLTIPWTSKMQIADLYGAIGKLYPFWKRDQFRLYGRCGQLYMPIKDYITMTATLRHMATYSSDLLYMVRTDPKDESTMTVEELQLRWHVREAQQEKVDITLIKKWAGDQGYEGRDPAIRGEHAPEDLRAMRQRVEKEKSPPVSTAGKSGQRKQKKKK